MTWCRSLFPHLPRNKWLSNKFVGQPLLFGSCITRAIFRPSKPEKPQFTWRKWGFWGREKRQKSLVRQFHYFYHVFWKYRTEILLIFHYVNILIGALHMEAFAGIFFEKFIIFQPFEHCTILGYAGAVVVSLFLQMRYTMTCFDCRNQITHSQNSRIYKYHSRHRQPYFLANIWCHNVIVLTNKLPILISSFLARKTL